VVGAEIVVVCVELDHDPIGEDEDAVDDAEDDFADGAVDEIKVCHVGCACEVQLESWWVDEGDLSCADQWNHVCKRAEQDR